MSFNSMKLMVALVESADRSLAFLLSRSWHFDGENIFGSLLFNYVCRHIRPAIIYGSDIRSSCFVSPQIRSSSSIRNNVDPLCWYRFVERISKVTWALAPMPVIRSLEIFLKILQTPWQQVREKRESESEREREREREGEWEREG